MSLGRRAIANTIANWIALGVATLASLVLTPFLIRHLGNEQFGIYQICRQVILYLALFDFGMMGSTMRFSSQAVAARDPELINETANGGLVLFAAVSAAALLASGLAAWAAPAFFRLDPAYVEDARWLFVGLGVWWALSMLAFAPRSLLIAHQRYGLLSVVTSGSWIITVACIVLLFELGRGDLRSVSLAFVANGAFQFIGFTVIAHRIQPTLRWSPRFVRRASLKTLYGFGLWSMLFTISGLFLWSSDNIIIGRTLGPEAVAFYAVPFMLISYGRGLSFGFATQMTPVAAGHLAQNDMAGLRTTLLRSTRAGLILTLATTGVLVLVIEDLLRLWLGPGYAASWVIYAYLLLSFWAVYASLPLHHILLGGGDIRWPAAISLAATATTLVLKALALAWLGLGIEAVALLNCVLVLPVLLVYLPWCACQLAGISLLRLYREAYLGPILAFVPVAGLGWLVIREVAPLTLLEFGVALVLLPSAYLLLALWTLSASERAAVIRMLKSPKASLMRPTAAAPAERLQDVAPPVGHANAPR